MGPINKLVRNSKIVIFLAVSGCDYMVTNDPVKLGTQDQDQILDCVPTNQNTLDPSIVTYERLKTEIFEAQCLRCHNTARPTAGVDLATPGTAKAFARQIDFQVSRGLMPPAGTLNPEQRGLISDWVRAGALSVTDQVQNCTPPSTASPNEPKPPTLPVATTPTTNPIPPVEVMPPDAELNFQFVRDRIFAFECFACHSDAGGNRSGLNLETYANTLDEIEDIEEEIRFDFMPPRSKLRPIDKEIILRWIALGAPR